MGLFEYVAGGLTLLSFVYCFVFVDAKGKGIPAMGKRLIYQRIPAAFKAAIRMLPCGDNMIWFVERTQSYVCFEANPAIQVFYLTLAVGGYYCYVVYGFVHIPNRYVAEYHTYIAWPAMFTCYWSYYKACSTNPGVLTNKSDKVVLERALKRYPYDELMFSQKSWCDTCQIPKPARSKHCTLCNVCCERFDHHCVWINNCVGIHNYKYFILFLVLHTMICIYGLSVGILCGLAMIDDNGLWEKTFYNAQGQKFRADIWILMNYLQTQYEMFFIVVFLCMIVTLMLLGFIGFHSYLIWSGLTTNEFTKRQSLLSWTSARLEFLKKWLKAREDKKPFKPAQRAIAKHSWGDISVDMSTEDLSKVVTAAQKQADAVKAGSTFRSKSMGEALNKIWNPNKFDIDNNPAPVSLEKASDANVRSKKTSFWGSGAEPESQEDNARSDAKKKDD